MKPVLNETKGKNDEYGFVASELIQRFAPFTGRKVRTEESIKALAESFLLHGQHVPFVFRKGEDDYAVPVSGHTRILAADYITKNNLTDRHGIQYSVENPFRVYGKYRRLTALDAVFQTFIENDDDTRTPINDVDRAYFIETLRQSFGLKDAEIAVRLGKPASWVSNHNRILDLDHETQNELASGDLAFDVAVKASKVPTAVRREAIKAVKEAGGPVTASSFNSAVRTVLAAKGGTEASTIRLPQTDSAFKAWVAAEITKTAVGPKLNFLYGIRDVRAGIITFEELSGLFETISDEVAEETKALAA